MSVLKHKGNAPLLLIAGEFYENQQQYEQLIDELDIRDLLILRTDFIPDNEVRNYICAADFVIQPYKHATQSGITPLSYHFEKPMLVTNVGALPAMVPHEKVGIVTTPEPEAIAHGIEQLYSLGEAHFLFHLRNEKKKYNWQLLTDSIWQLTGKN